MRPVLPCENAGATFNKTATMPPSNSAANFHHPPRLQLGLAEFISGPPVHIQIQVKQFFLDLAPHLTHKLIPTKSNSRKAEMKPLKIPNCFELVYLERSGPCEDTAPGMFRNGSCLALPAPQAEQLHLGHVTCDHPHAITGDRKASNAPS
jgi:hypothetical protein